MPKLDGFAPRKGPYSRNAELAGFRTRFALFLRELVLVARLLGKCLVDHRSRRLPLLLCLVLEVADERRFEGWSIAQPHKLRWLVLRENLPSVHHRHPVA